MAKDPYERFVDMSAYLFLMTFIEGTLIDLRVIAGQKTETIEETKKRMTRDSSK
jgi:hypothetical protein